MVAVPAWFVIGLPVLVALMVIVIIVLAIMVRRVGAQAQIDKLTKLWNRHFLEKYLPKALAKAARAGEEMAVICLDLDGFKAINDKHGHIAGDACLRAVTGVVTAVLRESDIVVRYGGDEFLVIISATCDEAQRIAEMIRETVATLGGVSARVTASIGVACFPQLEKAEDLIQAADDAMYSAKMSGRNRVIMWGEAEEVKSNDDERIILVAVDRDSDG